METPETHPESSNKQQESRLCEFNVDGSIDDYILLCTSCERWKWKPEICWLIKQHKRCNGCCEIVGQQLAAASNVCLIPACIF